MRMFATDYAIEVKCGVCKTSLVNKAIACFYTADDEGYYFEIFICLNCIEAIHQEVKDYGNKIESNKARK